MTTAREAVWKHDEATLAAATSDFGHMTAHRPAVVARVRHSGDIVAVLAHARRIGSGVAVRGQGHSTRGQASISDGILIDTRELTGVDLQGRTAMVGAGTRWDTLLARTVEEGLMPPVLTDYLGLSIGGTLAVGGVGGQSFRHGLQTDQIETLTIVTGAGELVECSETRERELFDACRAGLGQCGVIVAARLRLIEAPKEVRVYRLFYDERRAWLDDQRRVALDGRFDYLLGSIKPRTGGGFDYIFEVAKYVPRQGAFDSEALLDGLGFRRSTAITPTELPLFAYANRLVAMEAQMKREGTWYARHPWMDLFVASDAVDALLSIVLDELDPCWLVDSHTLTYPVSRAACRTPLVALGAASLGFLFGVGPNFTATDDIGFVAFEHACQRIYERSRELQVGVYPVGYPVGTPAMTEDDWRRQLPRAWEAWCAAKRQYDPHGLLPQLVTPASQG